MQSKLHELEIQQVEPGSEGFKKVLALRQTILRAPLGLQLSAVDLAGEENDLHFAAVDQGEVVACCLMKPVGPGVWKLRQFAVSSVRQGQGVGSWMLSQLERIAHLHGVGKIVMHARKTAVPFYEAQGYQRSGERIQEVSLPHWLMEKSL